MVSRAIETNTFKKSSGENVTQSCFSPSISLGEKQYVTAVWFMQWLMQNYIESPGHSPYHLPIAISKSNVAWFSQTCKWGYFQHAGMLSETTDWCFCISCAGPKARNVVLSL